MTETKQEYLNGQKVKYITSAPNVLSCVDKMFEKQGTEYKCVKNVVHVLRTGSNRRITETTVVFTLANSVWIDSYQTSFDDHDNGFVFTTVLLVFDYQTPNDYHDTINH